MKAGVTKVTEEALSHYRENRENYLEILKELTRIPSVSFDGYPAEEVVRSAKFTAQAALDAGFENIQLLQIENSHPYVYGDWLHAEGAPTLLLYAHHDVQPPMRKNLWNSPAFEPTQKEDRIFARGIADDKAGILVHLASVKSYLQSVGTLPVNVKLIIEGEEEIGSIHLRKFVDKYSDLLRSDCMILTDCTNYDSGIPSLTTSLRGLAALEISVSALEQPLHSGMWGGPIPDPILGLSRILSTLVDDQGRIAIPSLWEKVLPPTEEEIQDFQSLKMNRDLFSKQARIQEGVELFGNKEELLIKIWREPCLVINSVESGGKKIAGNVLMDSAWARIGLRLVPNMDPVESVEILVNHLRTVCPWGLKLDIHAEPPVGPWMTKTHHPVYQIAKQALSKGYRADTVFIGCGGTIPFVGPLSEKLGGIPALLVGVEDPYTNAHSENESLYLPDFHRAVESQIHLFAGVAEKNPF